MFSNTSYKQYPQHATRRGWLVGCALLIGTCGSDARGASQQNATGQSTDDAAAEVDEQTAGNQAAKTETRAGSDAGHYIYVGNFAGEPPAHDMFSEPGHAFIFGFVPDGKYVYQVTDAQCTELLAGPGAPGEIPNTEGRLIKASGGKFEAYPAAPFLSARKDTSGEYLVHVTPAGRLGMPSEGCYGFKPESTYTAKFAVVPGPLTDPSYCVSGGVFEAGEGMEGIEIVVFQSTREEPVTQTYSGGDGMYEVCGLRPGEDYQLKQRVPAGYEPVAPEDGMVAVTNVTRDDLVVPPFENKTL